jgi:hypothetical protein
MPPITPIGSSCTKLRAQCSEEGAGMAIDTTNDDTSAMP